MLSNNDYCDYDTCVALKELGYTGQGRCYYDLNKEPNKLRHFGIQVLTTRSAEALNFILAVHLYEAQKWLREAKHVDVLVYLDDMKGYFSFIRIWEGTWNMITNNENLGTNRVGYFSLYEEALLEGIKETVKILKEE